MDEIEKFTQEYRFRLASTAEERNRIFALRYEVFNQELNYSLSEDRVRQLEMDHFDEVADQCYVEHIASGTVVGCVRLVLPGSLKQDQDNEARLPIEHYCGESLKNSLSELGVISRDQLCEVSRLAIPRRFRLQDLRGSTSHEEIPCSRKESVLVGESLFLAGLAMVGLAGRQHILAFMEPKFPRLLARSGLVFQRVSDMFEICGRRAAYYLDQHQGVRKMQPGLHTLYRQINHELHEQYLRQQAIQAESH